MKRFLIVLFIFAFSAPAYAKIYKPNERGKFFDLIDTKFAHRNNLAVVHFTKHDISKPKDSALEAMQDAFRDLSRKADYRNAGLLFISINLSDIPSLKNAYNLQQDSTVLLFKNGQALKDTNGNEIALVGYANRNELESFIDQYLGQEIEKNREYMQQIPRQEMQYRRVRSKPRTVRRVYYDYEEPYTYSYDYYDPYYYDRPYVRPYVGVGYPYYYGYPYYGYGPGVSFGIGGDGVGFGIGFGF